MEVLGGSWRLAWSAQLRSGERRAPDCARRNLACQFRGPKSGPWCSNDRLVRRQRLARRRCRPRPEICGYVRFYILHRRLGHDAQSSSCFRVYRSRSRLDWRTAASAITPDANPSGGQLEACSTVRPQLAVVEFPCQTLVPCLADCGDATIRNTDRFDFRQSIFFCRSIARLL